MVVASRDRPDLLRRCLRGLAAQRQPPDQVVVVDDASASPTAAVTADVDGRLDVITLRNHTAKGPAAARNRGWLACDTDYVAFTDDDCRPEAGWLQALRSAAAPQRVLVGRTIPDPEDGPPRSVFDRTMRVERCDGGFPTCNVLYPRGLLEELNGFDTTFQLPYGEDTDLGQRALELGSDAVYAADALVFHAIHRFGVRAAIRERRRLPELVRLAKLHPQLRSQIWNGSFLNTDHRFLLRAAAGLAMLPASPVATALLTRGSHGRRAGAVRQAAVGTATLPLTIAAMAPILRYLYWADQRTRDLPRNRRLEHVAGVTLLDAVEVAYLVAGSVQHRTLLL